MNPSPAQAQSGSPSPTPPTPARLITVFLLVPSLLLALTAPAPAPPPNANYDESLVPAFTLPDPLALESGEPVADADSWRSARRPELLRLFEEHVYGPVPDHPLELVLTTLSEDPAALDGAATRREIAVTVGPVTKAITLHLLLFIPNHAEQAVPAFLGLNFRGNQTIHPDPGIAVTRSWVRKGEGVVDHQATEETRGLARSRWPAEKIISRGYALATCYYGDIDPDFDDGFENGAHALLNPHLDPAQRSSISAWAWGLSRLLDALRQVEEIDGARVALLGHSRLGKTSLWAGANDERFALVISNDSGCGGAALSRRAFGETVARINTSFPHWFCDKFNDYNGNEAALPVDQHQLLALVAPRPLYVASAVEDRWADPNGEFLSAKHAEPVYRLLEAPVGLPGEQPAVDSPAGRTVRYHVRTGKHDVTDFDWERYLDFADEVLPP